MDGSGQWVVFTIDRQRFAVSLSRVVRVLPAVEVTPVPGAPDFIMGIFDLRGEVVPVLDRQARPAASLRATDQFVVVQTALRTLALRVDDVVGVVERRDGDLVPMPEATAGLDPFRGAMHMEDGLVLIHDIEAFLTPQEAQAIDRALAEAAR